jgi:hypothetical protein
MFEPKLVSTGREVHGQGNSFRFTPSRGQSRLGKSNEARFVKKQPLKMARAVLQELPNTIPIVTPEGSNRKTFWRIREGRLLDQVPWTAGDRDTRDEDLSKVIICEARSRS